MTSRILPAGARPTRRDIVKGAALSSAVLALPACDLLSTEPQDNESTTRDDGNGKEAPSLAAMVEEGTLPPLEDRLPKKPLVIEPTDRIGVYGGTWHTATQGPADSNWAYLTSGYDQLVRWNPDCTDVIPDLAESYDVIDDGREYVIKLREGTKWSDGEPFTADDIVFAYNDYLLNTDLSPELPGWLTINGEPGRVEKVDNYTVRFSFSAPNGLFLPFLANFNGTVFTLKPKHHLAEFHIDHNPDANALAEEEGLSGWVELFNTRGAAVEGTTDNAQWSRTDLPVLTAWRITTPYGAGQQVVAERNPYYSKVDPNGRQLPYLDKIVYEVVTDAEVMLVKATNGEFDMHTRHFNSPVNKPVLAQGRVEGDYDFLDMVLSSTNVGSIELNLTHEDTVLREVFQNLDFRIGLSHAINRPEVIKVAYQDQGEPWQAAPSRESEFFHERLATQYIEYDVDKANEHLDKAGYTERDENGIRLRPDGKPIRFFVEVGSGDEPPADLELISGYWHEVGIDMQVRTEDRSLYTERTSANKHDAARGGSGSGLSDAILYPDVYFPFNYASIFAMLWANWYTGAEPNEEPPEGPRRQMELYDRIKATGDPDERHRLFMEILEIAAEEFYVIGVASPGAGYGIVKNTFHNVPKSMPASWNFSTPGPSRPEQYFTSEE